MEETFGCYTNGNGERGGPVGAAGLRCLFGVGGCCVNTKTRGYLKGSGYCLSFYLVLDDDDDDDAGNDCGAAAARWAPMCGAAPPWN